MRASLCARNFLMHMNLFSRNFFASSPLATVPLPSPRETHFWYAIPDEVQSVSLQDQYLEMLSPCEQENVFRMRGDALQKRALLARVLVRTTLARYTNSHVSPRSLKFAKNIFGKPEIGVDVEEKQRRIRSNISSFAQRYFSPREVEFLDGFTDPEMQRQEFIKLWTLKEAYVKALGRGFSAAPFRTFTIQPRDSKGMQIAKEFYPDAFEIVPEPFGSPQTLTTNWQFALFELACSHYAAVCVEKDADIRGEGNRPSRLKVWRTLPFVEDEYVSGTDALSAT